MEYLNCKICYYNDINPFSTVSTVTEPSVMPPFLINKNVIIKDVLKEIYKILSPPLILENSALQLCKFKESHVEYGPFLDFDLSLLEQQEELDSFLDGSNVCVLMRTKLAVRVEALIEKINSTSGRELRRALFSLKQIFQEDKDLVQEFVARRGLYCLRQIGSKSDQNHQNYILRALGQLMLYVDGMNGVLSDPETIEWLYSLLQNQFRLVVKLALKLLVVFIEYAKKPELHASAIILSISEYHRKNGGQPWSLAMKILAAEDTTDSELVTYALTFLNKVLSAIPNQDTFYDVTDWLEEQGMEKISIGVLKKSNADVDMVKQFQIYETALKMEDDGPNIIIKREGVRNLSRAKSETNLNFPRKSKRLESIQNLSIKNNLKIPIIMINDKNNGHESPLQTDKSVINTERRDSEADLVTSIYSQQRRASVEKKELEDSIHDIPNSSIKRDKFFKKKKRSEQYKSLENLNNYKATKTNNERLLTSSPPSRPHSVLLEQNKNSAFPENIIEPKKVKRRPSNNVNGENAKSIQPLIKEATECLESALKANSTHSNHDHDWKSDLGRKNVKVSEKSKSDVPKFSMKTLKNIDVGKDRSSEVTHKHISPVTDVSGTITIAKDSLMHANDKTEISPTPIVSNVMKNYDISFSNESPDWIKLAIDCSTKPLILKDYDFSDLTDLEDTSDAIDPVVSPFQNGIPPPPLIPPVPLPPNHPLTDANEIHNISKILESGIIKNKRTTKLHWGISHVPCADNTTTIWATIKNVTIDAAKLESLFENKFHDSIKKYDTGPKKIEVLDLKRSNAINIGMKNLPPIPSIKSSIINMHTDTINREGVEKLLTTMLPTLEEIENIKAKQSLHKDASLGQAEAFLMELHEVNLLQPRLEVWLFQMDFDQVERDLLESLMDLKCGIKEIYASKTLTYVLSTILTIGNFLNCSQVGSFSLNYLQKVPEVKDTKNKRSLLYHIVMIVLKEFPNSTDLHSDFGALNRCHRRDWDELSVKLHKLKKDCIRSWDYLKTIFKSDQTTPDVANRLKKFFWIASEAIVRMDIIYRRVMKRFEKVLKYLGFSTREVQETNVQNFSRIMSDFAIEYRTMREKLNYFEEKKERGKERKKTRGEMIADIRSLEIAKEFHYHGDDLIDAIMSRSPLLNSDCDNELNSIRKRWYRRSTQNHITIDSMISPTGSTMTRATSELSLDLTDTVIDRLAQQATSSCKKTKTVRRSGEKERKSGRKSKQSIVNDVAKNVRLEHERIRSLEYN